MVVVVVAAAVVATRGETWIVRRVVMIGIVRYRGGTRGNRRGGGDTRWASVLPIRDPCRACACACVCCCCRRVCCVSVLLVMVLVLQLQFLSADVSAHCCCCCCCRCFCRGRRIDSQLVFPAVVVIDGSPHATTTATTTATATAAAVRRLRCGGWQRCRRCRRGRCVSLHLRYSSHSP